MKYSIITSNNYVCSSKDFMSLKFWKVDFLNGGYSKDFMSLKLWKVEFFLALSFSSLYLLRFGYLWLYSVYAVYINFSHQTFFPPNFFPPNFFPPKLFPPNFFPPNFFPPFWKHLRFWKCFDATKKFFNLCR